MSIRKVNNKPLTAPIFIVAFLFGVLSPLIAHAQQLKTGAEQLDLILPTLEDKKVALVVNQTSTVGSIHLVDIMLYLDLNLVKVFAPEHGFRGVASAGEKIANGADPKSGLPIVSLYGSNKKPLAGQLENVDVIIFDIQDVGARFYTYISTMHYVMEAAAENNVKVIILDRPNPNGMYVDGPILQPEHKSFVGMHPIPILHGLTVGELAKMINGEGWLEDHVKCDLTVVPMLNYTHGTTYSLPVKPSPNLPNDLSVALYPSLCLFEGTVISVGRGTDEPFQQIGHPSMQDYFDYHFEPIGNPGAKHPKHEGKMCYGISFEKEPVTAGLTLQHLISFYEKYDKNDFFNGFFTQLAGTDELQKQIESGMTEEEIKATWQTALKKYKSMRKQYLLYPDN